MLNFERNNALFWKRSNFILKFTCGNTDSSCIPGTSYRGHSLELCGAGYGENASNLYYHKGKEKKGNFNTFQTSFIIIELAIILQ